MTPTILAFAVLAIATIASAIGVIAFRNAVYSALSLILTLFFLAMFYLQLGAMFIAVVQILIYAGAIMVLFLFVVTMLSPDARDEEKDRIPWQRYVGGLLGVVLAGALSYLIFRDVSGTALIKAESYSKAVAAHGNVEAFGLSLFHGFLFPFEVTSLLIVVAILGALVFGRRA
ncbi:NADH-quinone oxidoreductase subunit J [Ktedonospora formicarum]|uniref:NADH-quinone oxidoreductase subunit J n=1 Tax=Ktedonospora formicarum TaxID=2778364 RepID=A0A8J3I1K5_9CHLR|nr:NADH-quinone oxidoreductase subunit J [Ktedonospora formicarum]GHO44388.1 NADH-quinone oxidoreductase subunit J [Ktedonospora formicarum]